MTLCWGCFPQSFWKIPRWGKRGYLEGHRKKEVTKNLPTDLFIESNCEAYVQGDKQETQSISNSNLIGPPTPHSHQVNFRYNPSWWVQSANLTSSQQPLNASLISPTARWGPSRAGGNRICTSHSWPPVSHQVKLGSQSAKALLVSRGNSVLHALDLWHRSGRPRSKDDYPQESAKRTENWSTLWLNYPTSANIAKGNETCVWERAL